MTPLLAAAFATGMVATVNPSGFAMVPAYLGLILGDRGSSRGAALLVGAAVSTGFVAVFLVSGFLVVSGLRAIVTWIPWMAVLIGLGLMGAGVAELRGVHLFARLPGVKRSSRNRSLFGLVGFGASNGVASLSCTLPIFLSLIGGTVATGAFGDSIAVFAAYGAGMSLMVIVVTVTVAAGRDCVPRALRSVTVHLATISGWIMVVAGSFVVWYWATVLGSGAADLGANPAVRFVERLSADLAGLVFSHPALAGFGALLLGLIVWALGRRPARNGDSSQPDDARTKDRIGRTVR